MSAKILRIKTQGIMVENSIMIIKSFVPESFNLTREIFFENSKRNLVSPSDHVISSIS